MKPLLRLFALLFAVACMALAGAPAAFAAGEAEPAQPPRIMVMLRLGANHFRSSSEYGSDYGDAMTQEARLRFARKLAKEHRLRLIENWPMEVIGVDCVIYAVEDGRTAEAAAGEIDGLPGVQWSQPLNQFELQGAARTTPYNDRLFAAQPASSDWNLRSLHRFATGRGQTIAVVDSRIDVAHPDLAGQVVRIQDFAPGNRQTAERHGTGVAGIIAARANNVVGIAGIAPSARIVGLRACWERPTGTTVCDTLSLAKAMTAALQARVDVVNLSLSGPPDRLLARLITLGLARGMTIVAAVDAARPEASFPASIAGVIPVADERLSARATTVYIAPGRDIPTTEPEGRWSLVNGSSYAAAHVSGLAALLRQLSGGGNRGRAALSALGARGTIDACAAIARVSALDAGACRSRN